MLSELWPILQDAEEAPPPQESNIRFVSFRLLLRQTNFYGSSCSTGALNQTDHATPFPGSRTAGSAPPPILMLGTSGHFFLEGLPKEGYTPTSPGFGPSASAGAGERPSLSMHKA